MAATVQLNATDEVLLIVLIILIAMIVVTLTVIVYKKRNSIAHFSTQHKSWHGFVMLNSPDHMIALKNSESMSFDDRRKSFVPIQQQPHHLLATSKPLTSEVHIHSNCRHMPLFSYPVAIPQSPEPVYYHGHPHQ